jgi:signal transduction histidine kinase
MAALNVAIAMAYVYIAARIVPRFDLPRAPKLMAGAFLVACSLTHVELASHSAIAEPGSMLLSPHMFAIHGAQVIVDWGFIVLASRHLRIMVAADARKARAAERSEAEQRALAREQAALRRVAVAVASGAEPEAIFAEVAREVAGLLRAEGGRVVRFAPDGRSAVVVGAWRAPGLPDVAAGTIVPLDGGGALSSVRRTGHGARVDLPGTGDDPMRSRVAAPIRVGSALWGAIGAATSGEAGLRPDAEDRLSRFAELVGLAIANADAADERRRAEAEVRRQALITHAVVEAAPVGIALVDQHGQVALANPMMGEWEELRGAPDGRNVYEKALAVARLTEDPAAYRAGIEALVADPKRRAVDRYTLIASGRSFERYAAPVTDGGGELIGRLLVLREVTLEDRTRRATDEFIALASHELRTPLTSVMGFLELLVDEDADPLTPGQRHFLGVIERNGERLQRLVGDLMVVARGDAGRLGLEKGDVDLGEVAAECVAGVAPLAAERGLDLAVRHEALPVTGDRARLAQVIDNLLSNALKFTPPGGRIRVRAEIDGDEALVEVADDGPGIGPDDQPRLFERFFRTEAAVVNAVQGTGLGLAIAKMMVEAHGGAIAVESAEGAGATFRVRLPLRAARPAPLAPLPA